MADKVLLVDDEEEFTEALSMRLENRGMDVDICNNGHEALDKIGGKSYDAIILDLKMPGIDGIETLKRIKDKNPNLQIILLTGHATVKKSVEAIKLGAIEFFEKPVEITDLIESIEQAKANKTLLVEKHAEDRIKKIMKKMGW